MAETAARARRRKHEPGDVDARPIILVAAGLAAILVLVAAASLGSYRLLRPDRAGETPAAPAEVPAPRLQSAPASDLVALRRQKNAMLDEYRWIDRQGGVVRIPIDRAMQLLSERDVRATAPPPGGAGR
jgi:hypothetical protein